jgi:DNA-binding XRE family transcriptional regulator
MNTGDIRKYHWKIKATKIYETIGINQSTYSKIENNKYKLDIETLKKIAGVVDLIKLIDVDKTEINHTNINSQAGPGIVVTNSHCEKLLL